MGKGFSGAFNPMMVQKVPEAKPIMGLVDSFCDTYKAVRYEDEADEVFTISRIREYFSAWPIPKMPDPLGCYLEELERRGFVAQTTFDGQPAIFVVRWKSNGEMCGSVEDVRAQEDKVRTGAHQIGSLLASRKLLYNRDNEKSGNETDFVTKESDDTDDDEDQSSDVDEDDDDETFSIMRYGTKRKINKDDLPY